MSENRCCLLCKGAGHRNAVINGVDYWLYCDWCNGTGKKIEREPQTREMRLETERDNLLAALQKIRGCSNISVAREYAERAINGGK